MMQLELNRLATFRDCQQKRGQLSCLTLARRGFYYNGHLSACFRCHVSLPNEENITADNLDEVHRLLSLDCSRIEADNVPLTRPSSPTTESDSPLTDDTISATYQRALARAKSRGVFSVVYETGRGNPDPEQYCDEAARLKSFHGWPQRTPVRPEELAAAGFLYTGTGDRVRCAFCGGVLGEWQPGDDPTVEHERYFGDRNCPFPGRRPAPRVFCNDQLESNLPVAMAPVDRTAWSEQTTLTRKNSPAKEPTMLTAEQPCTGPKHPEFASQLQRLRTFPLQAFRTGQRAESLARAGFFYEGPEDRVRCFHCAGVLKNWQPEDVAIDEHQRWYPRCQFLQQLRNEVRGQDTFHPMQNSTSAAVGLTATHLNSASVYHVEPREIKARMDSASVMALMQMGISRSLIRQAIEIRLRTTGDDFPSAEHLLEAVFDLQEQMSVEASHYGADATAAAAASHLSSTVSHVITAVANKEVHPTASANLLSSHVTQMSDASAINKPLTGKPAAEAIVASKDASNDQSAKLKSKNKKKQKKTNQEKPTDNKTSELNNEANSDKAEGSRDTNEVNSTCLEKEAKSIIQENRQLKDARTCKVCLDDEVNTVFLPCGHLVCCHSCSSALNVCPLCRVPIRGTLRVFLP